MQTFIAEIVQKPAKGATVHVALLDGDGAVIIHEELSPAEAPFRLHMLALQAELDVRDIPDATRKVYSGAAWPPPEDAGA